MRAQASKSGPIDPAKAAEVMQIVTDRRRVFELLLQAVRSKTRFAALLSIHRDELKGQLALADAAFNTRKVEELRIPRNTVKRFEAAISSGSPSVGAIRTGEEFIDGYIDMLGHPSGEVLVMPIVLGAKAVGVVVAHRGDAPLTMSDVSGLFSLVSATSQALMRLHTTRKRAATPLPSERADTEYDVEVTVLDVDVQRKQLETLRANGSWAELAEGIRRLLRHGMDHGDPEVDEQLELFLELGIVELDHLAHPDAAREALRSAQTIDAGDPRVLEVLERLHVVRGEWADVADVLEKRAALTDDHSARVAILVELAAITDERLHDDARTIAAYERVLSLEPDHEKAGRELEVRYTAREDWPALIALLLDRASRHEDPQQRVSALMSVANLYEGRIGDGRDAFLVWLTVFRREPERPHLIEQLTRLADNSSTLHELVSETSVVADELAAHHPNIASNLWKLVGAWHRDRLGNRDAAAAAFERAAELDPNTLGEAAEHLRADGRLAELAALIERRIDNETDVTRRAELCCQLGELYESDLGQPGEAARWFERAQDHDPAAAAPLVALHRIYLAGEAWDALGELLPKLIDTLGPSAPRSVIVDLRIELADILADHLHRPDEAIEAYRDALALDEKNAAAFRGLARVYEATGQTEALLDATETEVDVVGGPGQAQRYSDIAAAWYEVARLDRAGACWRKVLAVDPRNISAHKGLARALRDEEQWADLAGALRAQLKHLTEPFERVALLLEMAELLERTFDNVDGAIAAHRDVLALDPDNRIALDALGRLYERSGQWQPALDMLKRMLADVPAGRERADLLQRIGNVHLGARDAIKAEAAFGEAITIDPDNPHAQEGAARVLLQNGKLAAGAEKLVRAANLAATSHEMLRLLADAAWVYRYRTGDNAAARSCLQRILEIDPQHGDAKQALTELLHDSEEWAELWTRLEPQAAQARVDEAMPDRHAILAKAARCALELGKTSIALELYDVACAADPTPQTQLDRAEALYRSKALDAAAAAYQTIATAHGKALDRAKQIELHRRLGAIYAELGRSNQAVAAYAKALELDPTDQVTLDAVTELHLAAGQYDEAIGTLRARIPATPEPERIRLLERIGDLYRDKLANPARAMSAYLDALELNRSNHRVLQRVLDLQSEAGQWKAAIETIDRFLEIESDRTRRAAYLVASAEIRRTHLKDQAGALDCYETALDEMFREEPLSPSTRERALSTFNALREAVSSDDKYLEQTYRRMIKRIPMGDPILVPLWDALGDVYRLRLDHPQSAIEAFEVAHALDPDKSAYRTRLLADLYARTGEKRPSTVSDRAAKLVEIDPTNPDPYRAVSRSALAAGRIDEAWCVSRALVFLKQANNDDKALYRRFQSLETRKAKGILDEDAWAFVRSADEDRTISAIFALTWEGAVALRAGPAKAFELKPKERLAIEDSTGVVAKIFKHASRVLNVGLPDVYVQPRRPGRLLLANCVEKGRLTPAVIVGRDLMTGYRDTEIAASVGAMLALLRPAYYLKLALSSVDELEAALHAAALVVGRQPRAPRPELAELTQSIATELQKRINRQTGEAVLELLGRLPERPDLARWRNAVDVAAQRAALLISGDLAATARMAASETQRPSQRIQELVAYSVSPAYFTTRRHLQVTVD